MGSSEVLVYIAVSKLNPMITKLLKQIICSNIFFYQQTGMKKIPIHCWIMGIKEWTGFFFSETILNLRYITYDQLKYLFYQLANLGSALHHVHKALYKDSFSVLT